MAPLNPSPNRSRTLCLVLSRTLTISAPKPTTEARTLWVLSLAMVSWTSPGSHVLRLLYNTTTFGGDAETPRGRANRK